MRTETGRTPDFLLMPFFNSMCLFRVPLHKTRSLRRLMNDNGRSLEELRALAQTLKAADSAPSSGLPVERLTNFMDVCANCKKNNLTLHLGSTRSRLGSQEVKYFSPVD